MRTTTRCRTRPCHGRLVGGLLAAAALTTGVACSGPGTRATVDRAPATSTTPALAASAAAGSSPAGASCRALPLPDRLPADAVLSPGGDGTWRVTLGPRLVLALRTHPSATLHLVDGRPCADGDAPVLAVTRTAVSSAVWRGTGRGRSLVITPTWAVRGWAGGTAAVLAQLEGRLPEVEAPGMTDQLRCHVAFAPLKATWDLEPARPTVGYPATVAARCNPGAVVDPDGR